MTQPPRTIKSTPFSHESYEAALLAFSTDPSRGFRGKFAPYVKRLIERDRDGVSATTTAEIPQVPVVKGNPDKRAMVSGFL